MRKMDSRKIFGEMMRNARKGRGITQENFAKSIGISTLYCRELEHGRYNPTWIVWLKICTELNIDIKKIRDICIIPSLTETAEILGYELNL